MSKSKIERYLKNVDVQFISLVDSAANRREFIYKSEESGDPDFSLQVDIAKTDEEKQLVYGVVYAPDEADAHGDAMTKAEIEKAAHNFLAKARTKNVDTQHDFQADDGLIVESAVLKKDDEFYPGGKEGSWVVAIKVTNEDTWEAVKKGELKGISLAGKAVAEKVEEETEKQESKMQKFFKGLYEFFEASHGHPPAPPSKGESFEKGFKDRMTQKDIRQSVWALEEEFNSIFNDEDIEDKKAAIETAVSEFQEYISGLQLGGTTQKSETTMSTEEKEQKKSAEQPEAEEKKKTEKSEEPNDSTQSEEIEELKKTIEDQNKRIEELEKAAPGRQSTDDTDTDEEEVKKSNPKAPLPILGN